MRIHTVAAMLGVGMICYGVGGMIGGCGIGKRLAKSVLDAALVECVYATKETDATAVADGCDAARTLLPVIVDLIGQREAAKVASMRAVGVYRDPKPSNDAGGD